MRGFWNHAVLCLSGLFCFYAAVTPTFLFGQAATASISGRVLDASGAAVPGATVETLMPTGDPRELILDTAKEWPADLIVLGSHGLGGFDRFLMGSVSESVAVHAHCSVEVVRGNNSPKP